MQSMEYDPTNENGESGEDEWESSEEEEVMQLVDKQRYQESQVYINWDELHAQLDADLPKIPARPVVEQINPPPYA